MEWKSRDGGSWTAERAQGICRKIRSDIAQVVWVILSELDGISFDKG